MEFVTYQNHFNGSVVPSIDIANSFEGETALRVANFIKATQRDYIYKVFGSKLFNEFNAQLTLTTPQNSTLPKFITIENTLREIIVQYLYVDILQLLKTIESVNGSVITAGKSAYDKSILPTYYNQATSLARQLRETMREQPNLYDFGCLCCLPNLKKYPF